MPGPEAGKGGCHGGRPTTPSMHRAKKRTLPTPLMEMTTTPIMPHRPHDANAFSRAGAERGRCCEEEEEEAEEAEEAAMALNKNHSEGGGVIVNNSEK